MKFGISMFPTDYAIPVTELGRAVEDLGFDSLYFPEHTHIPTSRLSPWPGGAELPREYSHTQDPFVALAAVAAVTKNIKLGTGICLIVERDPITTAKEVATVDLISGGRFIFGIGGGWNYEEMENHGTRPSIRWKLMRERILAMKEIWTKDEPEFHGQFVNFDPIWAWPKPVQKPHPPILMGGAGPRTFERTADYCDGWMPIGTRGSRPMEEMVAEFRAYTEAAGRGRLEVSVFGAPPKQEILERWAAAGVDSAGFNLPPVAADEALSRLKQYAEVARQLGQ